MKTFLNFTKHFFAIIIFAFIAVNALAVTHYVSPTGGNISPFTSWANAATNIQDAVDIASADETIIISNGTYQLNDQIVVEKRIIVQGNAGADASVVVAAYPKRCFYIASEGVVIKDLTISNGYVFGGYPNGYGGGLFFWSNGVVRNCVVVDNYAGDDGGGIYADGGIEVYNCSIYKNECWGAGGGIGSFFSAAIVSNSSIKSNDAREKGGGFWGEGLIYDSVFDSNTSVGNGGGIYCNYGSVIKDCEIIGNQAENGGGAFCKNNSKIEKGFFVGNSATRGGDIYCDENGNVVNSSFLMSGAACGGSVFLYHGGTVSNCSVSTSYSFTELGGGIFCDEGGLVIHSRIHYCEAEFGGGVYCSNGGTVVSCTINNNIAEKGGGIYLWNGGYVWSCIITNNTASSGSGYGGGLAANYGGIIRNSLLIENHAYWGGGAHLNSGAVAENCTVSKNRRNSGGIAGMVCEYGGTSINCIVYYNQDASDIVAQGAGNLISHCCTPLGWGDFSVTNAPKFVNINAGNYRLEPDSHCINAGTNLLWMTNATDLEGNPRIYNGKVDIGCYEFVPEPCLFIIYNLLIVIYYRNRKLET